MINRVRNVQSSVLAISPGLSTCLTQCLRADHGSQGTVSSVTHNMIQVLCSLKISTKFSLSKLLQNSSKGQKIQLSSYFHWMMLVVGKYASASQAGVGLLGLLLRLSLYDSILPHPSAASPMTSVANSIQFSPDALQTFLR